VDRLQVGELALVGEWFGLRAADRINTNMDSSKTLFVFPDTNVFVQCKQLQALSWSDLGPYENIILMVTRPVIAEVDRQKAGSGKLARRARLANGLFAKFLLEDHVSIKTQGDGPSVVVSLGQDLEPSAELNGDMNYSHVDDLLVGIAHAYQKNTAAKVLFLSYDTGPLLRAKRVGVPFQRVPEAWLLTAENDEHERKIQDLEAQLRELSSAEPKCTISFEGESWTFTYRKHLALSDSETSTLMNILIENNPITTDFTSKEPERRGIGSIAPYMLSSRFMPPTDREIRKYNESYHGWVDDCERFLKNLHSELDRRDRDIIVTTLLSNEGNRPAEDVVVRFDVVGAEFGILSPTVQDDEDEQRCTELPSPPSPPEGKYLSPLAHLTDFTSLGFDTSILGADRLLSTDIFSKNNRDANDFYWKFGKPKSPADKVEFECKQWRHQAGNEEFRLRLVSIGPEKLLRGALHVTVSAANLRAPVKSTKSIQLELEEVNVFSFAKRLVAQIR